MIHSLLFKLTDVVSVILLFINFSLSVFSIQFSEETKTTAFLESKVSADSESIVKKRFIEAEGFYKKEKYKDANEKFEDLIRLIENDEEIKKLIDTNSEIKKYYVEAKAYIDRTDGKLASLIDNHLNKAKQSKKLSEIIRELKSALNIDPELTEAKKLLKDTEAKITEEISKLYFKGVDLYSADKLYEAIKIWKEALELKPDHARIKKDLARAESKLQLLNK